MYMCVDLVRIHLVSISMYLLTFSIFKIVSVVLYKYTSMWHFTNKFMISYFGQSNLLRREEIIKDD